MSIIQVKFDHNIKQTDILIPLHNSSYNEVGESYTRNQSEIQQTSVYGIQSPLIMINNIVVDFSDVLMFELKSESVTPTVSMTVRDRYKLTQMFDSPSIDNELRVQILPKFDNKYKKINLTFYIVNIKYHGDLIMLKGEYKSPKFISTNIKSFGEINTYKLFEKIAIDTGLGFATNMAENDEDKRWVYCDNKSYNELLRHEVGRSNKEMQICDYWVDWWNNLVLADIYERYNSIDKDEDMQIWVSGENREMTEGIEIKPQQTIASLTNNPVMSTLETYIKEYNIINSPGIQSYKGTDKVFSIYEEGSGEYMDHLIQDGDAHKDIFEKYEYLGEVYGGYNYLLSGRIRDAFLQKIKSNENIEVTLGSPLLGVMRGNRVNIFIYYNDSSVDYMKEGLDDVTDTEASSNLPLPKEERTNLDGQFILDKTLSGQYLITACNMKFSDMRWKYTLTLSRPTSSKENIIKDNE